MSTTAESDNAPRDDSDSLSSEDAQLQQSHGSRRPSLDSLDDFLEAGVLPIVPDDSDDDPTFVPAATAKGKGKAKAIDSNVPFRQSDFENPESNGGESVLYEDRPNKFNGAPSTWRSWTEAERGVVSALENAQARDLSIHLYNAFAMKMRARRSASARDQDHEALHSSDNADTFKPPRSWTAWPLPPDDVPREYTNPPIDSDNTTVSYATEDHRPSAFLEGMIIATSLKLARDMTRDRESEPPSPRAKAERSELDNAASDDLYTALDSLGNGSDDGNSSDNMEEHPLQSSTGGVAFLADDDVARSTLLPIARHVLSRVDNLLTSLHTVRTSYASEPDESYLSDHTSAEDYELDSVEKSSSRDRKWKRSRSKARPRKASGEADDSDASLPPKRMLSGRQKAIQSSERESRRQRKSHLGLRDWSEVLGTASLVGWSPMVIARTSERCARLFGQDQLFRTFHEDDDNNDANQRSCFTEHTASGAHVTSDEEAAVNPTQWLTDTAGETEAESEIQEGRMRLLQCPFPECKRAGHRFVSHRRLRKHIEETHPMSRYDRRDFDDFSSEAGVRSSETESEKSYPCPVARCKRAEKPFRRLPNLYSHIRKRHYEIDVERFKKLQAKRRGETRGKWNDTRRRRSRKRSSSFIEEEKGDAEH